MACASRISACCRPWAPTTCRLRPGSRFDRSRLAMPAAGMHAGRAVPSDAIAKFLRRALLAVAACLLTAPALAQRGAMTVPRNLDQLTDRASDIVRGTVVEARV